MTCRTRITVTFDVAADTVTIGSLTFPTLLIGKVEMESRSSLRGAWRHRHDARASEFCRGLIRTDIEILRAVRDLRRAGIAC